MQLPTLAQARFFLKDTIRKSVDFTSTPQHLGVPAPPLEKPFDHQTGRIDLTPVGTWKIASIDLETAIRRRASRREYRPTSFSLDELSFLLWATQGIRRQVNEGTALRTVPSAGARHALETYLAVRRVAGMETGLYRYLPLEHQLLPESGRPSPQDLVGATFGQKFVGRAAAVFFWAAVPARMEWRYGLAAHKVIALDAGHVAQNLYLACEAIGAGACAVAAYDQARVDALLGLDGEEEFVIYLAAIGKVA